MYEYRKMTREERGRVLAERRSAGSLLHAPPHFGQRDGVYLLTAACYLHRPLMGSKVRRAEWIAALQDGLPRNDNLLLRAWVALPNHYHLIVEGDLSVIGNRIGRLHNGKATQWNREDGTPGRRVWHRFADRRIRSEGHYYASLNYLHSNPVKHGYIKLGDDWVASSLPIYLDEFGRDTLEEWWRKYPIQTYGQGWDD